MAKAPLPFRYAGILTLVVLGLLALGGALAGPMGYYRRPEPGIGDPRWTAARAWVAVNPGHRVLLCKAPADLRRAGRLRVGPEDAPAFWDGDTLVQAVPDQARGALLRSEAGIEGWASWRGTGCGWVRATTLKIEGQRLDARGAASEGPLGGCGRQVVAGVEGKFSLTLGPEALEQAFEGDLGPVCALEAGGDPTLVDLRPGGARTVLVQAGPQP